ncbi:hypothetical protein BJ508DRAFT_165692 [Ascobolus immersus RN42]|uniref:polynucleotide adenylyltransferase n=1 Tax=Ascobolus immersus RN42 TaxID=1160509 RepID=A0A3N4HUT1_ASCIM|nr:hypothetical protein BJ508DRAFT_165692 [Ascobolus immersus RN42]
MSIDADKHLRSPTNPRQAEEATAPAANGEIGPSARLDTTTAAGLDAVAQADSGITSMTVNAPAPATQHYLMAPHQQQQQQQHHQQSQDGNNAGPEVAGSDLGNLEGHVRNLILHNQDQPNGTDTPPQMHANLPAHGPPMGMGMPHQQGYEQQHPHPHMQMSPHPQQMPPPFMYQQHPIHFGSMPPPAPMHGYPPPHFYPHPSHFGHFEGYHDQHFGVPFPHQYAPGPAFSPENLGLSHPSSPAQLAGYPPPPMPPQMPMPLSPQGVMPVESNGYGPPAPLPPPPAMEMQAKQQGTPPILSPGSASPANSQRGLPESGPRSHPRSRPVSEYANGAGRMPGGGPPPVTNTEHYPPLGSQRGPSKPQWGPQQGPPISQNQQHPRGQGYRPNFKQQPHVPRQSSAPRQLPPIEDQLKVINEVAEKYIKAATPSEEDLAIRKELKEDLEKICQQVSPNGTLELFGSVASGFATVNSDLDLIFCEDGEPREDPFEVPIKLTEKLKQAGFNILMLPKTRVPIIKVNSTPDPNQDTSDPKKAIAVDIGFGHKSDLAFRNTELLQTYAKCDARLKPMVLFVKWWSKMRKINNTYRGTLSSYGYVLMIIHYLINIVKPPVLVNLQSWGIPEGTPESEVRHKDGWNIWYWKEHKEQELLAQNGGITSNKADIGLLLRGFFEYYAKDFEWNHHVISIRTKGGLLTKVEKDWKSAIHRSNKAEVEYKDRYLFAIEDPFETTHNISRTCSSTGVKRIRFEFNRASRLIHFFSGEQAFRDTFFEEAPEEWRPPHTQRFDNSQPRGGYHGARQQRASSYSGGNAYNGNGPYNGNPQYNVNPEVQHNFQQPRYDQQEFQMQQLQFSQHMQGPGLGPMQQGAPPLNAQPYPQHPQFIPGPAPPGMNHPQHQAQSPRPPVQSTVQAPPQQPSQPLAPAPAAQAPPPQAPPAAPVRPKNRPLVLVGSTALEQRMS